MEEFATPVASYLVSKLAEYLFAPIGRQFGYVMCYKSYVQDLEKGVKELNIAWERVQHSVDEALYDEKPIHADIKNWLESVKNGTEEAANLLKQGESAKIACFRGWLPNPVVRHAIGRKMKKMTQVLQELHNKSRNNFLQKVYHHNIPMNIEIVTASAKDVPESRASIANKIIKAIAYDNVCVVGVFGPRGIGKSKLLEYIERQVKKEKLFDVVAVANVSCNPDLKIIQGEIADALGLRLMNVETARGRADHLHERLECNREKNILIILDNLWKKLELKDVGIPCDENNEVRGCKLLLTSRSQDVLHNMASAQEFQLNELDNGEARSLFERTLGYRVHDDEFNLLVDGVIEKCGGLPFFIILLAKRLKNRNSAEWRNALTHMEGLDAKSLVELNYNDLKDERVKSLFLLHALISGRSLMRGFFAYGMGLGLYKEFGKTIETARDRLIMDLQSLQDSSLLLDSDDVEEMRMHDIFVDVAISIASIEWNALVGRKDYGFTEWSKDDLRKCIAISFPYVGINELPEKLDCPNLRMFFLLENTSSLKIPESFFESMEKLQVLDLTGFSFTSPPSSIEFLENLKSLCLDGCHLEDMTVLGKLKGLEFLSFYGSAIPRLPKEIGGLTELRFLDLTGCIRLKVIEPGVLGSLVNLEELYMEESFDQWEAEDEVPRSNASLIELNNMKKLSTLSIAIPHPAHLPKNLPFGELHKHKIQIGGVWDWSGEYTEFRTLKLELNLGILLEEWVRKCLQRTQDLHFDGLQDGSSSIHDLCIEGLLEVKYLHVQNSPSIQYVVHSTENVQCFAFPRLESLFLENLNKLEKICSGCLALECFNKLKIVKVDNCGEIKHLFPLSMKRIIPNLEEIEISRCHLVQQIVADAEVDKGGHEIDDDTKVKPCNLRRLILRNLPKMTSFCKSADHSIDFFDGQQVIELQRLEAVTIEKCQLIQEVFDLEGLTTSGEVEILSRLRELTLSDLPSLGHIWNKNPRRALCFQNLRALKVHNCENLRFLFSPSMAKALKHIKEIEIVSCKLMEDIIDVQEEELEEATTIDTLEFPLLTSLSLEELPNLKAFSHGNYYIHCPSLKRMMISGCPKMMTFSSFEGE